MTAYGPVGEKGGAGQRRWTAGRYRTRRTGPIQPYPIASAEVIQDGSRRGVPWPCRGQGTVGLVGWVVRVRACRDMDAMRYCGFNPSPAEATLRSQAVRLRGAHDSIGLFLCVGKGKGGSQAKRGWRINDMDKLISGFLTIAGLLGRII